MQQINVQSQFPRMYDDEKNQNAETIQQTRIRCRTNGSESYQMALTKHFELQFLEYGAKPKSKSPLLDAVDKSV